MDTALFAPHQGSAAELQQLLRQRAGRVLGRGPGNPVGTELLPGRFVVFSGGKLELRKGQDIVVAAFRAFVERHPDAVLVNAWHNAWPKLAKSIQVGASARRAPPAPAASHGTLAGKPDLLEFSQFCRSLPQAVLLGA